MNDILFDYERMSRQEVNLQKFSIFFSSNVEASTKVDSSTVLGVSSPLDTCWYLGLPSLIGKNKRANFGFLKDML